MTNPHAEAEQIVNEVHYAACLEKHGVPEHLREGLIRYLVRHIPTGHFLTAVLSNDLTEAVSRGDEVSIDGLPAIVRFLRNDVPWLAWGSQTIVKAWLTWMREQGS